MRHTHKYIQTYKHTYKHTQLLHKSIAFYFPTVAFTLLSRPKGITQEHVRETISQTCPPDLPKSETLRCDPLVYSASLPVDSKTP